MDTMTAAAVPAGGSEPSWNRDRTPRPAAGADRRAGRRTTSMWLLLIGGLALVSGVWSLLLPRGSFAVPVHTAAGILFGLLSLVHVRYNRNAVRLYLRDLGWPPVVLRLVIAASISLLVLAPILRIV